MSLVDKALKSFEYTTEWADLIAALGKLNKVLLAHTKYPIVPRRIVISKRLAQCMHPALPSGVHLKALDTYDVIFKCMGTNRCGLHTVALSSCSCKWSLRGFCVGNSIDVVLLAGQQPIDG